MLLKSLILHYHGLDEDEKVILDQAAMDLDAVSELDWANAFISQDYLSAFDRSREFFAKTVLRSDEAFRLEQLKAAWDDNNQKGYVTEMETMAMIGLSKDWGIEQQFMKAIQS